MTNCDECWGRGLEDPCSVSHACVGALPSPNYLSCYSNPQGTSAQNTLENTAPVIRCPARPLLPDASQLPVKAAPRGRGLLQEMRRAQTQTLVLPWNLHHTLLCAPSKPSTCPRTGCASPPAAPTNSSLSGSFCFLDVASLRKARGFWDLPKSKRSHFCPRHVWLPTHLFIQFYCFGQNERLLWKIRHANRPTKTNDSRKDCRGKSPQSPSSELE